MTAADRRNLAALSEPVPYYVDNVEGLAEIKQRCLDSTALLDQDKQSLVILISKLAGDLDSGNAAIEILQSFVLEQHTDTQQILSKLLLHVATLPRSESRTAESIKTIKALQILVCSTWDSDDGWHVGKAQLNALFDNTSFFYKLVGAFVVESLKASQAAVVIIHYFYEGLLREPEIAACAFEALTQLAGPQCGFPLCRMAALRLLCSIRCSSNGTVYLKSAGHSGNTAAALGRTHDTSCELVNDNPKNAPTSTPRLLWMYEDPQTIPDTPTTVLKVATDLAEKDACNTNTQASIDNTLQIDKWVEVSSLCVTSEEGWEMKSFVLAHLGHQLRNTALFANLKALQGIAKLRQELCSQVVQNVVQEPPLVSGLKRADVALCIFDILSSLIPYASMDVGPAWTDRKEFGVGLVRAFLAGITGTQYDGAGRDCIHALSVCSLEFPELVVGLHPAIVTALAKNITQASLTVHILEFFSQLAGIEVFRHDSRDDEVKTILGVCIQLLHRSRERDARIVQQSKSQAFLNAGPGQERAATPSRETRLSESKFKRPPYRASIVKDNGLHRFASALAYHTMIVWYLAISVERRNNLASWIFRSLIYQTESNQHAIEEQGEVFLDMMLRCTRPDVNGTTSVAPASANGWSGDEVVEKSWVVGSSIVTLQTAVKSGRTRIVQRLASATVMSIREPSRAISDTVSHRRMTPDQILPHIQLIDQGMPLLSKNIALPESQAVQTSLNIFDRVATLDSYKAGVLFVGPGQSSEAQFYPNDSGTPDYHRFLAQLGAEVSLKPTPDGDLPFQAHGLRYDRDGDSTIAWRDHLTEIVFLCATMMPLDQEEEEGSPWQRKKGHLGNSFATIVFNRSGQQWDFDNLKTQFNFVTIVLEPADRGPGDNNASADASLPENASELQSLSIQDESMPQFYQVQVLTKPGLPNISPAATPKIVSAANVARFVRMLAINGVVFSKVQESIRQGDKEFPSEWRERLQQIKALRARYGGEEAGGSSLLEQMDFKQWIEDA